MKDTVNVITAGPSAGKSSTIRELSSRGYRTLPEAARILFDQAISEGRDPDEVRQNDDFHEQVENLDRHIESHITGETVFLDRSLADNVAYRRRFGNTDDGEATFHLLRECENRYDNVFLLDRLPMENDAVRTEDEDEARKTHEAIRQAYLDLGMDPIEIPVMPVDERADAIEEHITHAPPIH